MAGMNVWQGGIRIVTQEEIDEQNKKPEELTGQVKFDTCKHRSDKQVEIIKRSCCSTNRQIGWKCNLRNIFKLTPSTCATCTIYEKRT